MTKYLLAYHGGEGMGSLGAAFLDGRNPVINARTIAATGSVSDGDGANSVSGYGLIEAADFDAAVAHAQRSPILKMGGSIEVCETFDPM